MILLNDILLELLNRIRDIYCVVESLHALNDTLLPWALSLKNEGLQEQILSPDMVTKILTQISSPNLHVPQYNFRTRNLVYKIY